ncbi:MAG: DUF4399 domain-containing protein [Pedosphaera sp.]|nr:DUF4399 domain-containing protein [Pedosphaera sp.]MSU44347.1 DUF4399 domain-containing protein [Pedosphaera sp.]
MKHTAIFLGAALLAFSLTAKDDVEKPKRTPSPKGAKVYIVSPADGATVKPKFTVIFGLQGMGICPAGLTAAGGQPFPNTGHHHLLVNADKMPPVDVPLVVDQPKIIKHFGMGQTEAELELPPGKHVLQLIFADHAHVPHEPPVISKKITITVKE